MVVRRGEIWWASLPDPEGSEPDYRRPLLIVQADTFNQSRFATIICVALTTNLRLADAPGNVLLPSRLTQMPRDSVGNVSQILSVNRRALTECAGAVPPRVMEQVEEGLRLILSL